MIRVGSRSSSEQLHTLTSIKSAMKENKLREASVHTAIKQAESKYQEALISSKLDPKILRTLWSKIEDIKCIEDIKLLQVDDEYSWQLGIHCGHTIR